MFITSEWTLWEVYGSTVTYLKEKGLQVKVYVVNKYHQVKAYVADKCEKVVTRIKEGYEKVRSFFVNTETGEFVFAEEATETVRESESVGVLLLPHFPCEEEPEAEEVKADSRGEEEQLRDKLQDLYLNYIAKSAVEFGISEISIAKSFTGSKGNNASAEIRKLFKNRKFKRFLDKEMLTIHREMELFAGRKVSAFVAKTIAAPDFLKSVYQAIAPDGKNVTPEFKAIMNKYKGEK